MDYSTWALLLVGIGAVLLIAEVFIPSGGVITVLSAASLIGAIVCAWHAWWDSSQLYFWMFLGGMATLLPIGVGTAFYVWPSTPLGKRAILEGPSPEEVVPFPEQEERFARMVGKIGETVTMLNPGGIVRIDGQRVHCQSEGVIIDTGIPVRVISASGNRLIVRRHTPGSGPETPSSPASPATPSEGRPLDFDIG